MANVFTLKQLEFHLWEAANILRGPVDATDFKTDVFPLLFIKRLSDVHDEGYAASREPSVTYTLNGTSGEARLTEALSTWLEKSSHEVRKALNAIIEVRP